MKKRLKRFATAFIVLAFVGELVARFVLGLGDIPVFIVDQDFEYVYAPNQNVSRFGNSICTNAYSMRSKPLSKKDKVRILKIGDSIINGGAHTDQEDLASTHLENALQAHFQDSIRVLNVSAASWGPDNAYAYIQKNGHFEAAAMVMVFSSHDWHDNMHHRDVVGVHPAWPKEKPLCALTDGWGRYAWPKIKSVFSDDYVEYEYLVGFDDSQINTGWQSLIDYAQKHNMELVVYLHPEQNELTAGSMNSYGQEIEAYLTENEVQWISGLNTDLTTADYRDNIHLNASGQKKMADYLEPYLQEQVKNALD